MLVGIAGGMRRKRKIGDVVFGEAIVSYEPGAIIEEPASRARRAIRAILSAVGLGSLIDGDTSIVPRPSVHEPPPALWQG